jgi:hypothetical protein
MGKFDVKIEKAGEQVKVEVAGIIDEDADFNPFSLAGAPSVELHLGNIKSINSCGIREWIKWVSTAGPVTIVYHECPKVIVDQINMVQGFLPASGKVMSFYVPYFSDDAGTEKNVLFRYGNEYSEGGVKPPDGIKDDQGNVMEMDVIESKYFKFIKK